MISLVAREMICCWVEFTAIPITTTSEMDWTIFANREHLREQSTKLFLEQELQQMPWVSVEKKPICS